MFIKTWPYMNHIYESYMNHMNHIYESYMNLDSYPPKNAEIALWPNTHVVKHTYYVSQKQNGFKNKSQSYDILLTFIF